MKKGRLTRGGEVDFKLRRKAAWLKNLPRMTGRGSKPRWKLPPRAERIYGRRSMLKAYYRSNFRGRQWRSGLMEAHARYLERGHGFERGHKEPGFDATRDSVDVSATSHNWALARDKLHWRLILSPDDADRIDLREHVRQVMAQMA